MNNHIVTTPAPRIREAARIALQGRWQSAAVFMGLFYLISTVIGQVLDLLFYRTQEIMLLGESISVDMGYGSVLYNAVITGPLTLGSSLFFLMLVRRQRTEYSMLFEGFSRFGRAFLLMILIGVRVFLWSLLFFIPGIIAMLRYSQAFYVMIDHPDYSASQCIEESKMLMAGNLGSYFWLNLTFIGWAILAALPTALAENAASPWHIVVGLVGAIPTFFLNAYIESANAIYYDMAGDRLVIRSRDTVDEYSEF